MNAHIALGRTRVLFRCAPPIRALPRRSLFNAAKTQSTPSSSSTANEPAVQDEDTPSVKPLQRPLGVHQRPSTRDKTWEERRDELMDQEKRFETRKHLVKEVTKGYFHDFNRLRENEGKMWLSPRALIKKESSLYFPDVKGERLDPRETIHTTDLLKRKISVVAIITTKASEGHVLSFSQQTLDAYTNEPEFQYIQINLQENTLKSFLVSMFLSGLKRQIPRHLHSTYLISNQNLEYVHEDIGMENKHIGYVYLVDEDLKIRWAGCSAARDEESEALLKCTGVLLRRRQAPSVDQPATSTLG